MIRTPIFGDFFVSGSLEMRFWMLFASAKRANVCQLLARVHVHAVRRTGR